MKRFSPGQKVVKTIMLEKDLKPQDLADLCGVTLRHIHNILRGKVKAGRETAAQIARVLNISTARFHELLLPPWELSK